MLLYMLYAFSEHLSQTYYQLLMTVSIVLPQPFDRHCNTLVGRYAVGLHIA